MNGKQSKSVCNYKKNVIFPLSSLNLLILFPILKRVSSSMSPLYQFKNQIQIIVILSPGAWDWKKENINFSTLKMIFILYLFFSKNLVIQFKMILKWAPLHGLNYNTREKALSRSKLLRKSLWPTCPRFVRLITNQTAGQPKEQRFFRAPNHR